MDCITTLIEHGADITAVNEVSTARQCTYLTAVAVRTADTDCRHAVTLPPPSLSTVGLSPYCTADTLISTHHAGRRDGTDGGEEMGGGRSGGSAGGSVWAPVVWRVVCWCVYVRWGASVCDTDCYL